MSFAVDLWDKFEFLIKENQEKHRELEMLKNCLVERIELESYYQRNLQNMSTQLNKGHKRSSMQDAMQCMKGNYLLRAQQSQCIAQQLKEGVLIEVSQLLRIQAVEVKGVLNQARLLQKELNTYQAQLHKAQDSYYAISKQQEDLLIFKQQIDCNIDIPLTQLQKMQHKNDQIEEQQQEHEERYKEKIEQYNQQLEHYTIQMHNIMEKLEQQEIKRVEMVRDIVRKVLVLEVSQVTNLLYETQTISARLDQLHPQYQLLQYIAQHRSGAQYYQKAVFQQYNRPVHNPQQQIQQQLLWFRQQFCNSLNQQSQDLIGDHIQKEGSQQVISYTNSQKANENVILANNQNTYNGIKNDYQINTINSTLSNRNNKRNIFENNYKNKTSNMNENSNINENNTQKQSININNIHQFDIYESNNKNDVNDLNEKNNKNKDYKLNSNNKYSSINSDNSKQEQQQVKLEIKDDLQTLGKIMIEGQQGQLLSTSSLAWFTHLVSSPVLRQAWQMCCQQLILEGRHVLLEQGYVNMAQLAQIILNTSVVLRDYECVRNTMFSLFIFYKVEQIFSEQDQLVQNNIYLQSCLNEHPVWKNIEYWESAIFEGVNQELLTQKANNSNNQQSKNDQIVKENNLIFNYLTSYAYIMFLFKVDVNQIKEIMNTYGKNFNLLDLQQKDLQINIDNFAKDPSQMKQMNSIYLSVLIKDKDDPNKKSISNQQGDGKNELNNKVITEKLIFKNIQNDQDHLEKMSIFE